MPDGRTSRGECAYCGHETSKGGMTRHLIGCPARKQAIATAEQGKGQTETLYHLRVQDAYSPVFWLDLEVRGSATLQALDNYLRAIWLECCGHLSQFSIGGWRGDEISMRRRIASVFDPGMEVTHIYDFGTSSETRIKMVNTREGKPTTKHPIALMARNLLPEAVCIKCGKPATRLCLECIYEEQTEGWLCEAHARRHPHDNYGEPLPIVNSPRLGMCGYDGPATPPY
ncbi:MAG TPA: hypothetical protein VKT32_09860 [Chthonomonadaceae bacterium]|nr:hypothetical protein [Chthonomonadaceae bacterium]